MEKIDPFGFLIVSYGIVMVFNDSSLGPLWFFEEITKVERCFRAMLWGG